MDSGAHAQPAGSHGVKAAFGPARMNAAAVGMKTGGFIMPTPLTVSDASRASLVRALLESFAFSIRANIEQIEAITRIRATRVSIGGGMTRTRAFVDICAAVLGRDLQVQGGTDATTLGAWLAARRALEDISNTDATCLAAGRAYRCHPAPALVDEYAMLYDEWTELVKSLDGLPM
jgi:sugar (pentulose or hexulose) kinase